MNRTAVSLICATVLGLVAACSANTPSSAVGSPGSAGEWLLRAETANQEADQRILKGDTDGARDILKSAVDSDVPGSARISDARAVRQDLFYRLASIDLGKDHVADAAAWATRGLDLGRSNDAFTSNLLIVRGHALERMNDANGASRDYHDALLVTEALLDQSLEGKTP